jgi:predicted ATP-grasp superfamily ATP-dependent carboligase
MENKHGAIVIEGHVQGLSNTRSLGEAGIPVYVIDRNNCIARYSKYCIKFFYCPDYISTSFIDFLMELGVKEKLDGWLLLPSNDHAVISISRNRERLSSIYKVITPQLSVIENIYDKSTLLRIAESSCVPIPNTFYPGSGSRMQESKGFPVLIKGKQGLSFYKATGKKVFFAEDENTLNELLRVIGKVYNIKDTFVQEFIPFNGSNKTISFTAFCIEGTVKTHWIGEKVREHPIRFGTATFARSIDCMELLGLSKRLLKKLEYTGVCEIEYLFDPRDSQYKLIEINARTWLWVGLAKTCGVNYALMIFRYVNGLEINYPSDYSKGINWVNYITDIPFSIIALIKGKLRMDQFFLSFKGKTTNAFFSWKDFKPGFMFFVLIFYIAFKRR